MSEIEAQAPPNMGKAMSVPIHEPAGTPFRALRSENDGLHPPRGIAVRAAA